MLNKCATEWSARTPHPTYATQPLPPPHHHEQDGFVKLNRVFSMALTEEQIELIMRAIDRNGDGQISYHEVPVVPGRGGGAQGWVMHIPHVVKKPIRYTQPPPSSCAPSKSTTPRAGRTSSSTPPPPPPAAPAPRPRTRRGPPTRRGRGMTRDDGDDDVLLRCRVLCCFCIRTG